MSLLLTTKWKSHIEIYLEGMVNISMVAMLEGSLDATSDTIFWRLVYKWAVILWQDIHFLPNQKKILRWQTHSRYQWAEICDIHNAKFLDRLKSTVYRTVFY